MWLILALMLAQDSVISGYVQRLTGKLASGVTASVVPDKEVVRAAAVSNDRIDVTSALVARAANEAELAGVLAHEIAHARTGQTCARFTDAIPGDTGARERERIADESALGMVTAAGYDPAPMIAFFTRLRRADLKLPVAFSAEDLLLERLQLEATDHPIKDAVVNTPEFDRVHARVVAR
jgi:predicted Zn-dependent protease